MTSWKLTALLAFGVVVAMSGVVLFVAVADDDYRFAIEKTADEPPRDVVSILTYDDLSPQQQQYFEQALQGNPPRFEEENRMPRVVERDGTYYISKAPRYYDWLDPRTFGPTLTFLGGAAIAIQAVRLDIGSQVTT
jgi:hypothetical protein